MTFQQLEYIVAVDKYRHFVNAATACGVKQSTLSSMIQKLEQEIDVIIFDRNKHPIEPTTLGRQIIAKAQVVLRTSSQLREMVLTEKEQEKGSISFGIIPSIAPYLLPSYVRIAHEEHPNIKTLVHELSAEQISKQLQSGELDMAIMASDNKRPESLLEISLYTERFILYVSPAHPLYQREWVRLEDLYDGNLWLLHDAASFYPPIEELFRQNINHQTFLEDGCLCTLLDIIDANGGYTIIPQLYAERHLNAEQKKNIRAISSGKVFRNIALVLRNDYVRERMVNIMADIIKKIIPADMVDEHLKKFKITL